jgi:putative ABC transport system permease protein
LIPKFVWENVRHKPIRALLSILLIAVPVTLILTLRGLSTGFIEDSRKRAAGIGADIRITPPGANVLSFSNATMTDKLIPVLAAEPHVVQAMGTVVAPVGGFEALIGIDPAAFSKMSGGFIFDEGGGFRGPNDVLIDSWYADQRHVRTGGNLNILNHDWHVSGVVEPGKLGHLFVQMNALQDLQGGVGKVSQIFLKLDNPENADTAVDYLKRKLDGYSVLSMAELQTLISVDNVPMLKPFLNVIVGISVLIAFFVVALSMYMAVLQRTREIGILKSMGAKNSFVMKLILAEAVLMGFGGTILGILLSYVSQYAIHRAMPASLPQAIVYNWWPIAGAVAIGASILGAVYPGIIAVRHDPIEALAYE